MHVARFGPGNKYAIDASAKYSIHLHKANCGVETMDLLTKFLATSKQVLGPDQNITKEVASALEQVVAERELSIKVDDCYHGFLHL